MSREGGLGGQGEENAQQAAGVWRGLDLVFSSPEPAWCPPLQSQNFRFLPGRWPAPAALTSLLLSRSLVLVG